MAPNPSPLGCGNLAERAGLRVEHQQPLAVVGQERQAPAAQQNRTAGVVERGFLGDRILAHLPVLGGSPAGPGSTATAVPCGLRWPPTPSRPGPPARAASATVAAHTAPALARFPPAGPLPSAPTRRRWFPARRPAGGPVPGGPAAAGRDRCLSAPRMRPSPAGQPRSLARPPRKRVRQVLPSNPIRRSSPASTETPSTRNPPAPSDCGSWNSFSPSCGVRYSWQRKLGGLPSGRAQRRPARSGHQDLPVRRGYGIAQGPHTHPGSLENLGGPARGRVVHVQPAGGYDQESPPPSTLGLGADTESGPSPLSSSSACNSHPSLPSLWRPVRSSAHTPSGIQIQRSHGAQRRESALSTE